MEGSFGTQKEHNFLRRVKVRRWGMEMLYIFFGIHVVANVVHLTERFMEQQLAEASIVGWPKRSYTKPSIEIFWAPMKTKE